MYVRLLSLLTVTVVLLVASAVVAGPYTEVGIANDDPTIVGWNTGYIDYLPAPGVGAAYQNPSGYMSLGDLYDPDDPPETGSTPAWHGVDEPFNGDIYDTTDSYGFTGIDDPGSITLTFDQNICNGTGYDFAVFENGFVWSDGLFAELAYVEVSSNGEDFARFESVSLTSGLVGGYGTIDPTDVYNLAGRYENGWGTPFDLDELSGHFLIASGDLDLSNILYVRLVDIPGNGYFEDSLGNPIYDAWVTENSGGYDFRMSEGVAVLNVNGGAEIPLPPSLIMGLTGLGTMALGFFRRRLLV